MKKIIFMPSFNTTDLRQFLEQLPSQSQIYIFPERKFIYVKHSSYDFPELIKLLEEYFKPLISGHKPICLDCYTEPNDFRLEVLKRNPINLEILHKVPFKSAEFTEKQIKLYNFELLHDSFSVIDNSLSLETNIKKFLEKSNLWKYHKHIIAELAFLCAMELKEITYKTLIAEINQKISAEQAPKSDNIKSTLSSVFCKIQTKDDIYCYFPHLLYLFRNLLNSWQIQFLLSSNK